MSLKPKFLKDKKCELLGGKYRERGPFWPQAVNEGGSLALDLAMERRSPGLSHSFRGKVLCLGIYSITQISDRYLTLITILNYTMLGSFDIGICSPPGEACAWLLSIRGRTRGQEKFNL